MKTLKKGFTIVELVIVIAVIAILAAVLIPTFSGVVSNANQSAALSEARAALTNSLTMSESGSLPSGTIFAVKNGNNIYYFTYKASQLQSTTKDAADDVLTNLAKIIVSDEANQSTSNSATLAILQDITGTTSGAAVSGEKNAKFFTANFGSKSNISAYYTTDMLTTTVVFIPNSTASGTNA